MSNTAIGGPRSIRPCADILLRRRLGTIRPPRQAAGRRLLKRLAATRQAWIGHEGFGAPPTAGNDTITNFTTGHDQIAVSAAGFQGGLTPGEDVTSVFESSGAAAFGLSTDRFHFDTT